MPSPYRDPDREGGWTPWVERLAPLMARPNHTQLFETSSPAMAYKVAHELRTGKTRRPPGRWLFRGTKAGVEATFVVLLPKG